MTKDFTSEPGVQLCAFLVGPVEYVVDIMRVEEILQPQRLTPLPNAPAWVEGVMNLRGGLIPVVSLRKRLQATDPAPSRAKPKWLVVRIGPRRVALIVDGVTEVIRVRRSDLKPVPPVTSAETARSVVGACGGGSERLRLLLDVRSLLSDPLSQQSSGT